MPMVEPPIKCAPFCYKYINMSEIIIFRCTLKKQEVLIELLSKDMNKFMINSGLSNIKQKKLNILVNS